MTRRRVVVLQGLALVLVVGLVLVGGDRLARFGAESLLARDVRAATGVPVAPQTYVRSRPVLPQTLRGAYGEVVVSTRALSSGPLRIDRLDSTLTDVRMPFRDALLQDVRRVGVGRTSEVATLLYSDLNAYLDQTGRAVTVRRADDGGLSVVGSVDVLGRRVEGAAEVTAAADEDAVVLTPTRVTAGEDGLDSVRRLLLVQRLTLRVPLQTLPFGRRLTGVRADSDALRVNIEGRAVVLQP